MMNKKKLNDSGYSLLTINQTVVLSHLLLVLILISGLSLARFNAEWKLHVAQSANRAEDILLYHVKDYSILVAGRNYSNLMLPAEVEALYAHENLLFLDIKGLSDNQSKPVQVRYHREIKTMWREDITQSEVDKFLATKSQFESLLKLTPKDDVGKQAKLNYIIQKSTTDYEEGRKSLAIAASQEFKDIWQDLEIKTASTEENYYFDLQLYQIYISVPLRNSNGGNLSAIFDVSSLSSIYHQLLKDIAKEALIAIAFSLALILVITRKIVLPIKRLSKHMTREIDGIKTEEIIEKYRRDEIGNLARSFIVLITEIRSKVSDLKERSNSDALTGLGSRYKYSQQTAPKLQEAILAKESFAVLVCDIDNFKSYNDTYGHAEGDNVIKSVARTMLANIVEAEECYRIGGEEFVVLITGDDKNGILSKAEEIRQAIEDVNITHTGNTPYGVVSISIGVCYIEPSSLYDNGIVYSQLYSEMFNKADQQLYIAKSKGRNLVLSARFDPRGSEAFI